MIHLTIDNLEKEELKEFLQHSLDWLTVEVHHTDTFAFRDRLKQKRKLIESLLDQLGSDEDGHRAISTEQHT